MSNRTISSQRTCETCGALFGPKGKCLKQFNRTRCCSVRCVDELRANSRVAPVGMAFGRLTVLGLASPSDSGEIQWSCLCECGVKKDIRRYLILGGQTSSCGCLRRERLHHAAIKLGEDRTTHGESPLKNRTPEYRAWIQMKWRCENPRATSWRLYGGRGIRVCPDWSGSYQAFLSHIGRKPTPEHSLDRIDVNGHYEPGNVRWANRRTQASNRRTSTMISHSGETYCMAEWARRLGISHQSLSSRLKHGWSIEKALTMPAGSRLLLPEIVT